MAICRYYHTPMFGWLNKPGVRHFGIIGLTTVAVVLVSTVAYVLIADDPYIDPEQAFPEGIIVKEQRPEFIFPERVRTHDLSLNRFVDRFARICMQAKYSDFRLMLSSRIGDPIVASRFESMFNALRQIRILSLERAPNIPNVEGPVYIMLAEYDLAPEVVKRGELTEQRRLAILKEKGEWRIGPVPSELIAQMAATPQPASQPSFSMKAESPDRPSPRSEGVEPPKASANAPARISP